MNRRRLLFALGVLTFLSCSRGSADSHCKRDDDCSVGKICLVPPTGKGTCKAVGQVGDPCNLDTHCIKGAVCRNSYCFGRRGEGERCLDQGDCEPGLACDSRGSKCLRRCSRDKDCSAPLRCVQSSCRKPAALWEPCESNSECSEGLLCVSKMCNRPWDAATTSPCPSEATGREVAETDAGLIRCVEDGGRELLTTEPGDLSGALSSEGNRLVFLRPVGQDQRDCPLAWTALQVTLLDLETRKETPLARDDSQCFNLDRPRFLADSSAVLVDSYGCRVTYHDKSECLIDLQTKKMTVVSRLSHCAFQITAGRFRGHLFVHDLRFVPNHGPSDRYAVVDKQGRSLLEFKDDPFPNIADDCDVPQGETEKFEAFERKW